MAPALELQGVRFRVWRGALLRVRGEATRVTLLRDTGQLEATDLRAELPSRDQPVLITAPLAHGKISTQEYTAEGGVVVTHGNERAVTDHARWQPGPAGQGIVTGDAPVTMDRQGTRLEGTGFTFEPQSGELRISGPVNTHAQGQRK